MHLPSGRNPGHTAAPRLLAAPHPAPTRLLPLPPGCARSCPGREGLRSGPSVTREPFWVELRQSLWPLPANWCTPSSQPGPAPQGAARPRLREASGRLLLGKQHLNGDVGTGPRNSILGRGNGECQGAGRGLGGQAVGSVVLTAAPVAGRRARALEPPPWQWEGAGQPPCPCP